MAVTSSIYQDIIDWAQSQQNREAANGGPADLAPPVRKALLELHQLLKPQSLLEPETGDTDWISLLQRYRDANPTPSGSTIPYFEKPLEDSPSHARRWFCYVSLYEHSSEPLPLPDPITGKVPSFGRKKDAKKYAAKCAVEWLISQGLMPDNGHNVGPMRIKTAPAPPQKRQRTVAPSPTPPPRAASAADSERAPRRPPAAAPPAPVESAKTLAPVEPDRKPRTTSRSSSEGPSVVKQVEDLCRALGATPPFYEVTSEGNDFYSGSAKLGDVFEDRDLPPTFGQVWNVYGSKKTTKEAMAEVLLRELRKIEAERTSLVENVFRDLPPPVS